MRRFQFTSEENPALPNTGSFQRPTASNGLVVAETSVEHTNLREGLEILLSAGGREEGGGGFPQISAPAET